MELFQSGLMNVCSLFSACFCDLYYKKRGQHFILCFTNSRQSDGKIVILSKLTKMSSEQDPAAAVFPR